MFTGIVTDVGKVRSIEPIEGGRKLSISTTYDPDSLEIGASICHAGVCLTVTEKGVPDDRWYSVEAWEEALRLTTIGTWKVDDRVNLERSLKVGDELGGHIVSGHVDGTAEILRIEEEGEALRFTLRAPDGLARFVARKGSVALDGTSLTVNAVEGDEFDVLLIRHSLEVTTWNERKVEDLVNFEVDPMARYAERLMGFPASA